MPRGGWRKPVSDRRLSDLVSVGVLTRVFPPDLVDEVIAASGRMQVRHRALPARVMAYFAIGLGLYSDGSYEDVLAQLSDGLSWASGWAQEYPLPSKSAIFQARVRLGPEPVQALFERAAHPLGKQGTPGVWVAGRRLVAVDGTCLDVADTPGNDEHFGRPGVNKGERAAFPQARVLAVAECGTHALFAARVGTYGQSEGVLAADLLSVSAGVLKPGMLLMADRGFFSYSLWRNASATGADLLWRIRTGRGGPKPEHVQDLPDGTWLARLRRSTGAAERNAEPMLVRVIDYTLAQPGTGLPEPEPDADADAEPDADTDADADADADAVVYRLFTTMLDPDQAPAIELAAAYAQRWEIENTFDELKTHQRGPRVVLRSKSPDLVRQEIWGHLCCHFAIRSLMADAADHAGHDPSRVSFAAALRIARQTVAQQGAFSP